MDKKESYFLEAKAEIGEQEYHDRKRTVFGNVDVLDYVDSLVLNLPNPCHANCTYCIDKELRKHRTTPEKFLESCKKTFREFPHIKRIAITGGSLNAPDFNALLDMIHEYYPGVYINWNTNGIGINRDYEKGIRYINDINLHRNAVDEQENKRLFHTTFDTLSINEAKSLFGKKLTLRVTIDEQFDIDDYVPFNVPLYINRLLPGTKESNRKFNDTLAKLNITDRSDRRRRNIYITASYQGVPVRVCVGDSLAAQKHVSGRIPVFLNVAIVHRSGIVCGTWYEDDKMLYDPDL